jgi:thymidine phosphorylase
VPAPRGGWVTAIDVRALGLAVVALGGGRRRGGDRIDPRVGLADVVALGRELRAGETLATVHAANEGDADAALRAVQAAITLGDGPAPVPPWQHATVEG